MPITPETIDYLDALCLETNDPKYLIANSSYDFRQGNDVSDGRNVASTLFTYEGSSLKPQAAQSEGSRERHSERMSFAAAIKYALGQEPKFGPFKDCNLTPEDIPVTLSIDQIKSMPELIATLKKLSFIQIFSERAICDFSKNSLDTNQDKGCLPYLEELQKLIPSTVIEVYQSIKKFTNENINQQKIREYKNKFDEQKELLGKKQEILLQKLAYYDSFRQDREKIFNETNDNPLVRPKKMRELALKQRTRLEPLEKEEKVINEQLREKFSIIPTPTQNKTRLEQFDKTPKSQWESSSLEKQSAIPLSDTSASSTDSSQQYKASSTKPIEDPERSLKFPKPKPPPKTPGKPGKP